MLLLLYTARAVCWVCMIAHLPRRTCAVYAMPITGHLYAMPITGHLYAMPITGTCMLCPSLAPVQATAANDISAGAIVVLTHSGLSAQAIAQFRPSCPILVVTREVPESNFLTLNLTI